VKFQRDPYSCGVFAILNALRALGHNLSEKRIRAHTGTTKADGTAEHGIKQALERLSFDYEEVNETDFSMASERIVEAMEAGHAAILLVQSGQHWAAAIGSNGWHLVIFDSQRTKKNKAEQGVHVLGGKKLQKFWTPYQGKFYALIVKKTE
jgi:ABC-type bacteriocin/lantibiotic exporter with double-glycine peptidase domain